MEFITRRLPHYGALDTKVRIDGTTIDLGWLSPTDAKLMKDQVVEFLEELEWLSQREE